MKFIRGFFFILLILGAGAGGLWLWQQRKPSKKPDLEGLRVQLDAAAERSFPVPDLAVRKIEITVAESRVGEKIARTIRAAEELGGTAMQGLDRDDAKLIMATVPRAKLEIFLESVQKNPTPAEAEKPIGVETEMADCEIMIRPLEK